MCVCVDGCMYGRSKSISIITTTITHLTTMYSTLHQHLSMYRPYDHCREVTSFGGKLSGCGGGERGTAALLHVCMYVCMCMFRAVDISLSLSHTHRHKHTLSHSLFSFSLSLIRTHTHTLSLFHSYTHSLSLSLIHTLSLSYTHTLSLFLSLSLIHTHTHSLSLSLIHTHTLSYTHTLSPHYVKHADGDAIEYYRADIHHSTHRSISLWCRWRDTYICMYA